MLRLRICLLPLPAFSLLLAACLYTRPALAQPENRPLEIGADLVSRYVWRGISAGHLPSLQPEAVYTSGALQIGTWGNYSVAREADNISEQDFYAAYAFSSRIGELTVGLTDYFYPGEPFFNARRDGEGSHTVEASLHLALPESVPFYGLATVNVYNDPQRSTYVELGYEPMVLGFETGIFVGAVAGQSEGYGVEENRLAFINTGVSVSHGVQIGEHVMLPLSLALIANPYARETFFVLGLSLSM